MSVTYKFDHMDASENLFFSRELEHIRTQALEVQYAQLKGKLFVPLNTNIDPGAEDFTYQYFDQVGMAKLIADYADDLPQANSFGLEATQKIKSFGASYMYSIQEARAAMKAGRSLDMRKAKAARDAIEQKIDDVLLNGDTAGNLSGFFNASGTDTYTVPNGSGGSTEWDFDNKTPDEIIADMHGMTNQIVDNTLEIHRPDTMLLPLSSYNHVASRRMGDGSSQTILKHFLETSEYVQTVMSSVKLETAGAGSTKRAIVYKRSPDILEGLLPVPFEQFAPQQVNLAVKTLCHARCGGVVIYFPKAICFADTI